MTSDAGIEFTTLTKILSDMSMLWTEDGSAYSNNLIADFLLTLPDFGRSMMAARRLAIGRCPTELDIFFKDLTDFFEAQEELK